ncbi:MAG TPA: DinB family protein [Terriglobia bacterium]|nr:DinB family protein [Terriglobia bacterium]
MNITFEQFPTSLDARLEDLRRAREHLLQEAESAPLDDAATGTNPDQWSVAEIVFHLHLSEKGTLAGLKRSLALPRQGAAPDEKVVREEWERIRTQVGTRAVKVKSPLRVAPANAPRRSEAIALIRQSRQELLATIQTVSYKDLLCVSMPHPFAALGVLTGAGWLSMTAFHDLRHAEQIREIKQS